MGKRWTAFQNTFERFSWLQKDFHDCNLIDLKPKDFEALKQKKLETLSVRSVEYMLAVARQIINHAIKNELVKNYYNPIGGGRVKIPKPDNAKETVLEYLHYVKIR